MGELRFPCPGLSRCERCSGLDKEVEGRRGLLFLRELGAIWFSFSNECLRGLTYDNYFFFYLKCSILMLYELLFNDCDILETFFKRHINAVFRMISFISDSCVKIICMHYLMKLLTLIMTTISKIIQN